MNRNSPRQRRNRAKAERRKKKLFAAMDALEIPEGYTLHWQTSDYGWLLQLALQHKVTGIRLGVSRRRDRLWRRMDWVPGLMLLALASHAAMLEAQVTGTGVVRVRLP